MIIIDSLFDISTTEFQWTKKMDFVTVWHWRWNQSKLSDMQWQNWNDEDQASIAFDLCVMIVLFFKDISSKHNEETKEGRSTPPRDSGGGLGGANQPFSFLTSHSSFLLSRFRFRLSPFSRLVSSFSIFDFLVLRFVNSQLPIADSKSSLIAFCCSIWCWAEAILPAGGQLVILNDGGERKNVWKKQFLLVKDSDRQWQRVVPS